jgi:O-antigen ligase
VELGLAGTWVVVLVTVVPLSGLLGDVRVATVSGTALVTVAGGAVSWTLAFLYRCTPRPVARVAAVFCAFLGFVVASLIIGGVTRRGVQFLGVQVAFLGALLVAGSARRIVGRHLERVVGRSLRVTSCFLVAFALIGSLEAGAGFGDRPTAIVALVAMGWFLGEYKAGNTTSFWWALALLIGITVSLSRSAMVAGLVIMLVATLMGAGKHRARRVLLCTMLVGCGLWATSSWAPLHDRFVQGDVSLTVAGVGINTEGRTEVWRELWSEVDDEILVGHGAGAASERALALSSAFDHPHNDYLRILYDLGVVGLGMAGWFVLRAGRSLRIVARESGGSAPALGALYASLAFLIVMVTDNPLDYSFVMVPLGVLIGLGLAAFECPSAQVLESRDAEHRTPKALISPRSARTFGYHCTP